MKRILILCLALLLVTSAYAFADEIIINKLGGDHTDFAFAPDAQVLEVYFPKIFGVDAALVRYGEFTLLIDCGGSQWKSTRALLEKLNVTELTYALNTHPDADHIGGFNHVLKDIPAGEFLLGFPEDHERGHEVRFKVYEALHEQGIPFRRVYNGDTIEFGDVSISVYQRTDADLPSVNDSSVMLMIQYGERRILFTGDIEYAGQTVLCEDPACPDLKADILKFPHHGYAPMHDQFLSRISPELVISTCGKTDTSGLKQLEDKKIPYYITANRIIRLATDGKVWTLESVN
ncbi:MAG: MBL fold metallo-hydrolase [Clostridia bacterium]|nr:MBL fold metallo-hydrolase [Clostridia bacterium]